MEINKDVTDTGNIQGCDPKMHKEKNKPNAWILNIIFVNNNELDSDTPWSIQINGKVNTSEIWLCK